jgi:hypothetical protein
VTVHASPDQVFRALQEVTLADMPLARALIELRYLPGRLMRRGWMVTPPTQPILQSILNVRWIVLGEEPGQSCPASLRAAVDTDWQASAPPARTLWDTHIFPVASRNDSERSSMGCRTMRRGTSQMASSPGGPTLRS